MINELKDRIKTRRRIADIKLARDNFLALPAQKEKFYQECRNSLLYGYDDKQEDNSLKVWIDESSDMSKKLIEEIIKLLPEQQVTTIINK